MSYDIIFSHLIWAQIWSGFIAFLNTNLRDRLIWVEHNMYEDRRKFVWYLLAKLGKFTKTIVAVSEEVSKYYLKNTNLKSIVIPNPVLGLPLNNFKRDLVDRKLRIVCLGRLVYQKRVDLALKLFKDFQTKNSIKINSELIIIGGGPLEKNLKLQAEVISNISFTGYLNHYESLNLLKGCHIYLNTSDYEGFCISRIEALSMGLCVLSRKNAGYTQLKAILGSTEKMEQIGIFFIDDDPIFFEQALIELSSAKYWTEEKINKRIEVSKVFLPKNISRQYLRLTNL